MTSAFKDNGKDSGPVESGDEEAKQKLADKPLQENVVFNEDLPRYFKLPRNPHRQDGYVSLR